jgi:uncharacterized membrane protein
MSQHAGAPHRLADAPPSSAPSPDSAARASSAAVARGRAYLHRFDAVGAAVAGLFAWWSLTPSLLPRTWLLQGVLTGITSACGYGLGTATHRFWRYVGFGDPSPRAERRLASAVGVVVGLGVVWFLLRSPVWQDRTRETFGMEPVGGAAHRIAIAVVAVLVFIVLIGIGRSVARLVRWLVERAQRRLPPRVSRVAGLTVGLLLVWSLVTDVLLDAGVGVLQRVFAQQNSVLAADVEPPASPVRSGSPDSLISWDDLGQPGRTFVTDAPTVADIDAVSGGGALEPIRVYVGRDSASTPLARAQLLLEEMRRAGAFDREVVVLATSTGSGGLDPWGIRSVEYLHNGDTAVAGIQYSFLPSWLSFYVDQAAAVEAASLTFDVVHAHWTTLEPATRPELYLFGVSLGSFGSERSSASIRTVNDPIDGAVWAGPTFLNDGWQAMTRDRDEGSPPWLPIVQDGTVVRFTGREDALSEPEGPWGAARYVYIQHPSDPVSFFSPQLLLHEPEWLEGERPPDFARDMDWYPFVTFWQVAFDLVAGGSVPPGFGHNFGVEAYVHAWAGVTEPAGWIDAQTDALIEVLRAEREERP